MIELPAILREPVLERLGWTLVHSVWECAAMAMALGIVLLFLRRSERRYLAGCAALAACLLAPVVTFVMLEPPRIATTEALQAVENPVDLSELQIVAGAGATVQHESAPPPDRSLRFAVPIAAVAWLVGVALLCARHVMGWMSLRRMRQGARLVADPAAVDRLHLLMQGLGMRGTIALAESARVQVPSMIGWLRPIILLPVGAMSGLCPLHLEAILAHELAHIRRHDYLANLVQTLIDTLLFYHPAVWWISGQIRQEREHCCDDLAVRAIGNAREYGLALAAMEELRSPAGLAMAASGGSLLKRIRRLAKPEPRRASVVWPVLGMIGVIVLIGACARTKQAQSAQIATTPPATQPAPTTSALVEVRNIAPATQADLDRATQELAAVAIALTEAQLNQLQLEATYGPDHPEMLRARKAVAEASARYQDKLRQVRILAEVTAEQTARQETSPSTIAAIRDAFGHNPSSQNPAVRQLDREVLIDTIRRLGERIAEVQMALTDARSKFAAGHPTITSTEQVLAILQMASQQSRDQLAKLDAETTTANATQATQSAVEPIARLGDNIRQVTSSQNRGTEGQEREQLAALRDLLSNRLRELKLTLEDLRNKYAADHPNVLDAQRAVATLTKNLAETEGKLQKLNADLRLREQQAPAATYYISGAPNSGMYPIPNGESIPLVEVINRAGAIQGGDMEKFAVIVHQTPVTGQKTTFIRVQDALNQPADQRTQVIPGDVIMVTTQGSLPLPPEARYTVEGDVKKPGHYPLQKNMTLLQAVVAAGVNPPESFGWTVQWQKAIPQDAVVMPPSRTVSITDLIGGAIGTEMIVAGDVITVKTPDTPRDPVAK